MTLDIVRRTEHRLLPDPSRVLSRMFVAGQDNYGTRQTRGTVVLNRVMQLTEQEVEAALADVVGRFGDRHPGLVFTLDRHAQRFARRMLIDHEISESRWKLIGATFTNEVAIEGASLSNPSAVPYHDQSAVPDGAIRFIMSVRCIGEGHRSSIGFRLGTLHRSGDVSLEPVQHALTSGVYGEAPLHKRSFMHLTRDRDSHAENAEYVLSDLGEQFNHSQLEVQLSRLLHNRETLLNVESTIRQFREIAERSYSVRFPPDSDVSERVLWPLAAAEQNGMEDARCVLLVDNGTPRFVATYTAFDGRHISQQLLTTEDFQTFVVHPITGAAAGGKGLAIFPRRVGGKFVALSRADHESNSITFSDCLEHWEDSVTIQTPTRPWEIIQMGNSGPPIETEAGWLVLTHAVGPMRTYYISAILLDLEDPTRVIASLDEPLISPLHGDRNGYVPNVVYSCGSVAHGDTLLIPFGIADNSIGIATASIDAILDRLRATA
jgi:predicted GH43/DUF377 family glycosyl hydrolase